MSPGEVEAASIGLLLAPIVIPGLAIVIILISRWAKARRAI